MKLLFLKDPSDCFMGWQPGGHKRPFCSYRRAEGGLHQGESSGHREDSFRVISGLRASRTCQWMRYGG